MATRPIRTLRHFLSRPRDNFSGTKSSRPYHSYEHPTADPYQPTELQILTAAMTYVPEFGFSMAAVRRGAVEMGYLEVTGNLFPRGETDLIQFHLRRERDRLRFTRNESSASSLENNDSNHGTQGTQGTREEKLRKVLEMRLRGNVPYLAHWQDALSVLARPTNLRLGMSELHALSDEVCHLIDDKASDMSWYTKRLGVSGIYASTDLFMTQDESPGFRDTWEFLDRRISDVHGVGSAVGEVSQFVGFQMWQAKNILVSKGIKI